MKFPEVNFYVLAVSDSHHSPIQYVANLKAAKLPRSFIFHDIWFTAEERKEVIRLGTKLRMILRKYG